MKHGGAMSVTSTGPGTFEEGLGMTTQERSMLWAMAFYVFFDSLGKILDLIERFIPEAAR